MLKGIERKRIEPGPLCNRLQYSLYPLLNTWGNKILRIYMKALNLNTLEFKIRFSNLLAGWLRQDLSLCIVLLVKKSCRVFFFFFYLVPTTYSLEILFHVTGDTSRNDVDKYLCPHRAYILLEKTYISLRWSIIRRSKKAEEEVRDKEGYN